MLDLLPEQQTDGQRKQAAYEAKRRAWSAMLEKAQDEKELVAT